MRRWACALPHVTFGRTRHTVGHGPVQGTRLPPPRVLLIEERPDGYFLIRYGEAGEFAGDTWHAAFEDAADQAAFEFDIGRSDWSEVPADEPDAVAYALGLG
jgi:hypothetical protein